MPTLFLSHGAPNVVLHDVPARRFFDALAQSLPAPDAIVVASAHYAQAGPAVTVNDRPRTIHDFNGFETELYEMRYGAPGAPDVAERVARLIEAELGIAVVRDGSWGLDHGAWSPLSRIYPEAAIPVIELSVQPHADPAHHSRIGRALATLRDDGVLVVGSGSITHNLARLEPPMSNDRAPDWVVDFLRWLDERLAAGDEEALLAYRDRAPAARANHPTDEHLLPLFVAMGAAGGHWNARLLHRSIMFGTLAMDAWRFD